MEGLFLTYPLFPGAHLIKIPVKRVQNKDNWTKKSTKGGPHEKRKKPKKQNTGKNSK
jgi:hypothetical protein